MGGMGDDAAKPMADYSSVIIPWGQHWTPLNFLAVLSYKYWANVFLQKSEGIIPGLLPSLGG